MNRKIKKTFIISSGRTGTEFLGFHMNTLSEKIQSVHEPDRITLSGLRTWESFNKINRLGFFNLFVLKALGFSGTRNLSLKRLNGKIDFDNAMQTFLKDRENIITPGSLYIEANAQLFGLVDDLKKMKCSKVLIIFRDPREWVRSWMNRDGWYDGKDMLSRINLWGLKRINPKNVGINHPDWKRYSRFQKLCWVWNFMNHSFYRSLETNTAKISWFFFEDLFRDKKEDKVRDFLRFALGELHREKYVKQLHVRLHKKINHNARNDFPGWQQWDANRCRELMQLCGSLMQKLGYGLEPEWRDKIN